MAEIRRDQQKLWLILFQIKGIRTRLNFIALQRWLFTTLALIIGSAALVFAGALFLSPLAFLAIAAAIALFALTALVRVARASLRQRANPALAAEIADQRAELKGRLTTVLAMANAPEPSPLWPYLVEDTYTLHKQFEPARIQPQWLSPSILSLLAALMLALLMLPVTVMHRHHATLPTRGPGEITADIGDLDVRPADPALEPNSEIYADAATLRRLNDKLAAARRDNDRKGVSRWMNHARDLASDLQNALTGQKPPPSPPLRLRLTDKNPGSSGAGSSGQSGPLNDSQNNPNNSLTQSPNVNNPPAAAQSQSPGSLPPDQADQLAQSDSGFAAQNGPNRATPRRDQSPSAFGDSYGSGGGGSSHGSGTDPAHLFGPPGSQPLGSDTFRITINAEPSDESSTPGAPAYVPPKIRVSLNPNQHGDEPLARAAVPTTDEMTIKRVFER